MELKSPHENAIVMKKESFNRTFMELKFADVDKHPGRDGAF